MRIVGIDGLKLGDVEALVSAGGRFVFFEFCVSFGLVTLRRPSDVYFLRAGEWGWPRGLPYTLLSLAFGWWGLPWGCIYTPITVTNNLSGGCDITPDVLAHLDRQSYNMPIA
jgi:hypothetical protein